MKIWTNQLIETKNLFDFLITCDDKNHIIKKLISFKKEEVNIKYGVFEDSVIPTLINL